MQIYRQAGLEQAVLRSDPSGTREKNLQVLIFPSRIDGDIGPPTINTYLSKA